VSYHLSYQKEWIGANVNERQKVMMKRKAYRMDLNAVIGGHSWTLENSSSAVSLSAN
jgi:hypothetical protein